MQSVPDGQEGHGANAGRVLVVEEPQSLEHVSVSVIDDAVVYSMQRKQTA